jgi:hypothetical protein
MLKKVPNYNSFKAIYNKLNYIVQDSRLGTGVGAAGAA